MTFFARPNLDDVQFKQISGSTLCLEGQTKIASPSGLTLIGEGGNYIPINLSSGNTNTNILTYIDGQIILQPQTGGGSGVYSGASPTTCTVGGLVSGSNIYNRSISDILQDILVPAVPLTTSLSISTPANSSIRQFGNLVYGRLNYTVTRNTNPINYICFSTGGTGTYSGSVSAGAGGTCSGTVPYTYPTPVPTSACTSHVVTYKICAKTDANEVSSGTTTITWQNRRFYTANSTLYSTSAITTVLNGLSSPYAVFATGKTTTIVQSFSNQFFYYAYPKVFGVPTFTVNGLPNNAWGSSTSGTLFTITYKNTDNYCNQYYVARSDNRITGSYTISVS